MRFLYLIKFEVESLLKEGSGIKYDKCEVTFNIWLQLGHFNISKFIK